MYFDFTNLRVSGTIGVEDVPLDVLLKVRDYLEGRMKESDRDAYGKLAESIVKATLHQEAQMVPEEKPAEEEADDSGDESETDDPHMRVLNAAIKELKDSGATYGKMIRDIFIGVRANPDAYTWEYLSTADWKKHYEVLERANRVNIGVVMRALKRIVAHKSVYSPGGVYENLYELPVPVHTEEAPEEEEVKTVEDGADALNVFVSEDKRKGEAVRKARNEAGFSVRELADLIGYDSSIIVNWENGLYKISSDAEDALKKLFGDNLFGKEGEAE